MVALAAGTQADDATDVLSDAVLLYREAWGDSALTARALCALSEARTRMAPPFLAVVGGLFWPKSIATWPSRERRVSLSSTALLSHRPNSMPRARDMLACTRSTKQLPQTPFSRPLVSP